MDGMPRQQDAAGGQALEKPNGQSRPGSRVYQIRVKGHLNSRWSGWFEGLAISHQDDGTTLLTGTVIDQPALHGLFVKIRDLGLPLVSVERMGKDGGSWSG
jgi:hypothetical protein